MILSGQTIKKLCGDPHSRSKPMISPFTLRTKNHGLTYGLGPAGYDVRVEFDRHGTSTNAQIHPGKFLLASTIERFVMPNDVMGIVHDKSTLARRGLAVQNTVIEPGWEGWLTLEITNHSEDVITILRGQAIAQIVFHRTDEPVELSYDGKYHNQERGPQKAR